MASFSSSASKRSGSSIQLSKLSTNESRPSLSANPINEPSVSFLDLYIILKSYFWPENGSDGAVVNRIRSSLTWIMVMLSKAASIMSPLYLTYATDNLVNGNFRLAGINILFYCLLRFLTMVFKEFQSMIYLKVKQQANIQLAHQAFSHIHQLSLNWHLNKKMGNIMRIMDRGTSAADTLVTYACLYLFPAFLECIAVCIFFIIKFNEWVLSVLIISGIIVYSLATIYITKWRKRFREASNQHDNDYHDKVTDSIINYETVKYFNGEDFEVNRFKSLITQYQSVNLVTVLSVSLLNIVQQFVINLTLFGAMYVTARRVVHGSLSIGDFIAVNTYTLTVFMPLSNLGMIYNMIVQGLIDINQFIGLLLTVPEILDDENAEDIPLSLLNSPSSLTSSQKERLVCQSCMKSLDNDWVYCPYCRTEIFTKNALTTTIPRSMSQQQQHGVSIEFKNVVFHYPSQPPASGLKGISFFVKPGTTTAIVGHSGSGKTTVSRLLYRFYDPLGGEVKIGGYNIKHYTQKSVRQYIGIVPQDTVLFNDTLLHNIHYGNMSASISEVEAVAESAKIKSFIENLPEKWKTVVGERGLKLSGGEKQRVAIARCLLKNPPIVILDEATSALDTITELSVQESLNTLGTNRTVLIIAHRLSTIMNADQILVMDNGEIIERGTHEELLQMTDGRYAALWMKQYKQQQAEEEEGEGQEEGQEAEGNEEEGDQN